jgi:hypothetical protein
LDRVSENRTFREEIMHRYDITATAFAAAAVVFSASYACAEEFTAHLTGFNEIGSIPTTVTVTAPGIAAPTSYTGAIRMKHADGTGLAVHFDVPYTLAVIAPVLLDDARAE